MKFTPLPHQKMAIDHLKNHRQAVLHAGCGLGKTASVLQAAHSLISDGKITSVLIVAPLRVSNLTWRDEIDKWGFPLSFANLRSKEGLKAWHDGSVQVFTLNFEALPSFCKSHMANVDLSETVLVIDELSKAKAYNSVRIKSLFAHRHRFKGHWGLTGTPIPNSYLELYGQYNIIDGGQRLGRSYFNFRRKYFNTDENGWNYWPKKNAEQQIMTAVKGITLALRSEDYLNIPDVVVEDIPVTLPAKARANYEQLQDELLLQLDNGETIDADSAMVLTGKLQQMTSGVCYYYDELGTQQVESVHNAKLKALTTLAKREKGQPLLVATNYQHERLMILDAIPNAKPWSDGILEDWNAGKVPMLVADPRSIGHGLNLQQGGSRIVWFSLTYSSELYDQWNARLARTGQGHVTQIFRLLCSNTIDDAIAEALRDKELRQSGFNAAMKNLKAIKLSQH